MADDKKQSDEQADGVETLTKKKRDNTTYLTMAVLVLTMIILVVASVGATVFVMSMNASKSNSQQSIGDEEVAEGEHQEDKSKQQEPEEDHKVPEEVFYAPLDPLVVNFGDTATQSRFLQVSIELMLHQEDDIDVIKKHMPVILDKLVEALSHQSFETLNSPEGKEKIRVQALEAVKKTMKQLTGKQVIYGLFFTGFIMQ